MFDRLRGELVELTPTTAVVDVSGVGYVMSIPLSTYDALKGSGTVSLRVHLHVREDDLRLFGFATPEERRLFRMVVSVSGVGPAIGLACLSALAPRALLVALAAGDVKALQRVKGVGRKVAERLVVDLKDRAAALAEVPSGSRVEVAAGRTAGIAEVEAVQREEAVRALVELGFAARTAGERADQAYAELAKGGAEVDLEAVVKFCLRR